jgi:drug/metabolite transporter (DMT)-like permease
MYSPHTLTVPARGLAWRSGQADCGNTGSMLIGVIAALLACFGYGTATVLQSYGARSAAAADGERGTNDAVTGSGAPSLGATARAALTPAFLAGMVLDVVGFVGSVVSARLIPLFLSQTIMSASLVVTAVLGVLVLGVRLRPRDLVAIVVVVVSLCVLGLTAGHVGDHASSRGVHWGVLAFSAVILLVGLGLVQLLGARAAVAAGLAAGVLFGAMAVAVRVVDGVDPLRPALLLADPATYAVAVAGVGGFYLFTVALQIGSVTGASAALVAGETVIPGIVGVVLLGDTSAPGMGWLVAMAFVGAVAGAVAVALFGAADAETTEPSAKTG